MLRMMMDSIKCERKAYIVYVVRTCCSDHDLYTQGYIPLLYAWIMVSDNDANSAIVPTSFRYVNTSYVFVLHTDAIYNTTSDDRGMEFVWKMFGFVF